MESRIKKALELNPTLDEHKVKSIFLYCDSMRNSMNVYGLRPYIADVFHMSKPEAGAYLEVWMKTYV